jgi:hypothetical protein
MPIWHKLSVSLPKSIIAMYIDYISIDWNKVGQDSYNADSGWGCWRGCSSGSR